MKEQTLKAIKEISGQWEIVRTGFFNEAYINVFQNGRWIATIKKYSYEKLKREFEKRFCQL